MTDRPLPIPLPPGADPRQTIERIAWDLINDGTSAEDKRAGRRLLGALHALWAEDGADLSDPTDGDGHNEGPATWPQAFGNPDIPD